MIFRSGRTPSRLKRVELGQRLVETPLGLRKAKEADALDKYLSWRGLPREQRHHLVGELLARLIAGAALLIRCETGLHRWRHKLDHLDLTLERLSHRDGVGMDGRLGRAVGRGREERHECQP